MRGLWRDRLACGLRGHIWVAQVSFGPGDVRDFSRCTRCGDIRDEAVAQPVAEQPCDIPH